jgi:hypothetical protein
MRTREDLIVRLLNGKVFKKNIFTLTLENVFWEEDFLIVDAILTSENSHQPFSTTDIFIWLDSIVESYVEKIYSNTKGPSVSYLPSIKYKNGKLKTGFILLSGEIEEKLIESIEDLYRKYSPEKVSQFIDFRSVYLGVAGGDSVLCEIIMKNDDDARDFRKVFIDIKSTSTFHFDARKKLREQIDKVLELCEQNSPAETVFDLEEIKVYPR